MKKTIYVLFTTAAFCLVACNKDDFAGNSTQKPTNPTISVIGVTSSMNLVEGDVITGKLKMSEPQIVDVAVHLNVTGGDASNGEDFALSSSRIIIPAYIDSAEFSINIINDGVCYEGDESFTLVIGDERTANAKITPVESTITISDSPLPSVEVSASWDQVFVFEGKSYDMCDFIDLDVYLYDENGNEITNYSGATGDCPEELVLDPNLANGTYELWFNAWDRYPFEVETCVDGYGNSYNCLGPFDIAMTVSLGRCDVERTFTIDPLNSTDDKIWYKIDGTNTGFGYQEYLLGKIEVNNGIFTLIDNNGENVGNARMSHSVSRQLVDKKIKGIIYH